MIYTSFNNNLHCDHQQHIVPADVGVPLTSTSGPSERDQVTVEEDEFLNRKQSNKIQKKIIVKGKQK